MARIDGPKLVVALMHGVVGVATLLAVWLLLPARWLWIDVPATLLSLALCVSCVGLFKGAGWALGWARAVVRGALAVGCLLVTLLAWSASQLVGQYGPVGGGGAVLLATIAALILPYFVGLPLLQHWLLRARS